MINTSDMAPGSRRWLAWRRRDVRDAIVLLGFAGIAYVASAWSGLFAGIHDMAQQHADRTLEEAFVLSFVLALAMCVFSYRRVRDLDREIAARRVAEQEAGALARHDSLTGLPNRRLLAERLGAVMDQARPDTKRFAVLLIGMNDLEAVNEIHGRDHGDKILIEFAKRLSTVLSNEDILARAGGNGFAIVQFNVHSLDTPTRLARRIVVAAAEPFVVAGKKTMLGVDIGIAVAPEDGNSADVLIRRAELSLHRANADEQSAVRFFEPDMDAHVEKRARLERDLRVAISASTIAPHYQPIVDLADGRIIGFEGLARWKNAQLEWVPPTSFIAIAEECGLIRELGDQLLRRACRDATSWPTDLKLTFNISPYQLRDRALALRILSILGETKLDPRRLEIEITDRLLAGDIETAHGVIGDLRRAGVCVALDGFGTGNATVSELLTLRFDKVKIARSIVHDLDKDPDSAIVIRGIIGLANALALNVAAKGIEKPQQVAQLKSAECREGQGFLFGQAIAPTEIPALLRRGPLVITCLERSTAAPAKQPPAARAATGGR